MGFFGGPGFAWAAVCILLADGMDYWWRLSSPSCDEGSVRLEVKAEL